MRAVIAPIVSGNNVTLLASLTRIIYSLEILFDRRDVSSVVLQHKCSVKKK